MKENDKHIVGICPVCFFELEVAGLEQCPACGAELELPEENETKAYPWVLVYTTNTRIDAEMMKANLESAEIPAHIHSQIDSTRMLTVGGLAIVKLYVPSPYVVDAEEIIKAITGNL